MNRTVKLNTFHNVLEMGNISLNGVSVYSLYMCTEVVEDESTSSSGNLI